MLNLSDKELDRLAREAASEYDPGDLTGPHSWDRMQSRLDVEMGSPRFNFFRSFRRTSFYYAPAAIMLLAGVTYFIFRPSRSHSSTHPPGSPAAAQAEPSGSPPLTAINPTQPAPANTDRSIKNQKSTYSPTSTQGSPSSVPGVTTDHDAGASSSSAAVSPHAISRAGATTAYPGTATPARTTASGAASHPDATTDPGAISHNNITTPCHVATHSGRTTPLGTGSSLSPGTLASDNSTLTPSRNRPHHNRPGLNRTDGGSGLATSSGSNQTTSGSNPTIISGAGTATDPGTAINPGAGQTTASATNSSTGRIPTAASPAPLSYSVVEGIRSDRPATPVIDDAPLRKSGLAAATAKAAEPVNPGKPASQSMRINRRLQLGISLAPEFTSVNSLAGDKPGSDIGITASYQFFSRLHLQTGFLLSHRNYTAAQQDYHVPYDYYRMNNMHDVYFVKGNLNLFEIPLNIRYDFSVTGNTSFFVSGGVSSYFLTHENCNYYFDLFGRPVYQEFQYDNHQNSLFGTVNLSMGVESGLTNSLSFMVAPYMKFPTGGLGFGKIEMNSIGVEFGLKYAPVLRRKRH